MMKNASRLLAILVMIVLGTVLQHYFSESLSLAMLQSKKVGLQTQVAKNQWLAAAAFATLYVFITTLSLPLALPMTLVAGMLFGFLRGLLIVSVSSTMGATLAFLIARFILDDLARKKFATSLRKIQESANGKEAFYLLSLRLIPVFPYFIVNIGMALTKIRTPVFFVISFFGMLPAAAIFVNAGVQISQIRSLQDIFSTQMMIAFLLLSALPLSASLILRSKNFQRGKSE